MRITPESEGLLAVIRLLKIELATERVARYRAEQEAVSLNLERAKLQLLLASRESTTGQEQMPLCAEAAERYFAKEVPRVDG